MNFSLQGVACFYLWRHKPEPGVLQAFAGVSALFGSESLHHNYAPNELFCNLGTLGFVRSASFEGKEGLFFPETDWHSPSFTLLGSCLLLCETRLSRPDCTLDRMRNNQSHGSCVQAGRGGGRGVWVRGWGRMQMRRWRRAVLTRIPYNPFMCEWLTPALPLSRLPLSSL